MINYISVEDLKVGDSVWFMPFSIKTKVNYLDNYLRVYAYQYDPIEVVVSEINNGYSTTDVFIKYRDTSICPGQWESCYGSGLKKKETLSLCSVLFKSKEDAMEGRNSLIDHFMNLVNEKTDNLLSCFTTLKKK